MNLSAGFLVVAFIAVLLVVWPGLIIFKALWRYKKSGRLFAAAFALALPALFATPFAVSPPIAGNGSVEENVVIALAVCSAVLWMAIAVYGAIITIRRACRFAANSRIERAREK